MAEANNSIQLAKLRTRLHIAIAVIARRAAIRETKAALQRQGRKPMHMPHREIVAAANDYLATHRSELIAEAKQIVERLQAEGFFGRAALGGAFGRVAQEAIFQDSFDQRAGR